MAGESKKNKDVEEGMDELSFCSGIDYGTDYIEYSACNEPNNCADCVLCLCCLYEWIECNKDDKSHGYVGDGLRWLFRLSGRKLLRIPPKAISQTRVKRNQFKRVCGAAE